MNKELIVPRVGLGTTIDISKGASKIFFDLNFDEEKARNLVKEFSDLAKTKGLTTQQAQQIFLVCSDYISDSDLK